jgi:hypothetical protein
MREKSGPVGEFVDAYAQQLKYLLGVREIRRELLLNLDRFKASLTPGIGGTA